VRAFNDVSACADKALKVEGLEAPERAILIQIANLTNRLKGKQVLPLTEKTS